MMDVPQCPQCSHHLVEVGFLFSGNRIVPRWVAEIKGFAIGGQLLGLQYACSVCSALVLQPPSSN
jgi:hypothetical protein